MLSEELGLQKLLEGREGRPCSGSARQFVRGTTNKNSLDCRACTDGSAKRHSLDEHSVLGVTFALQEHLGRWEQNQQALCRQA